jgi:hypothetical protein
MSNRRTFLALSMILFCATAVMAAEPMKALIVDGQNNHNWVETTPVLKRLLEETKLFTVDVATSPAKGEDMSGFKPKFADYDVVVSNYTGDSWPDETNQALIDYMNAGGGLVIFHAANNAFPKWKEYNEMIAIGGWGGRNEKSGPYLVWRDGKVVRDPKPGKGGGHGPQHANFRSRSACRTTRSRRACRRSSCTTPTNCTVGSAVPAKNVTLLATAYL